MKKGGGRYKTTGYDSVMFQVYTNCAFSPVKAERKDLTVGLTMDTPPTGPARDKSAEKRYKYWEQGKRLSSGSLVVLAVITTAGSLETYLGVLSSFSSDIAESSKASNERITVRLNGQTVLETDQSDLADVKTKPATAPAPKDKPRKGYVALQSHSGSVEFRKVQIRER